MSGWNRALCPESGARRQEAGLEVRTPGDREETDFLLQNADSQLLILMSLVKRPQMGRQVGRSRKMANLRSAQGRLSRSAVEQMRRQARMFSKQNGLAVGGEILARMYEVEITRVSLIQDGRCKKKRGKINWRLYSVHH